MEVILSNFFLLTLKWCALKWTCVQKAIFDYFYRQNLVYKNRTRSFEIVQWRGHIKCENVLISISYEVWVPTEPVCFFALLHIWAEQFKGGGGKRMSFWWMTWINGDMNWYKEKTGHTKKGKVNVLTCIQNKYPEYVCRHSINAK